MSYILFLLFFVFHRAFSTSQVHGIVLRTRSSRVRPRWGRWGVWFLPAGYRPGIRGVSRPIGDVRGPRTTREAKELGMVALDRRFTFPSAPNLWDLSQNLRMEEKSHVIHFSVKGTSGSNGGLWAKTRPEVPLFCKTQLVATDQFVLHPE